MFLESLLASTTCEDMSIAWALHPTNIELNGEHRHSHIGVEGAKILQPLEVKFVDYIFSNQVIELFQIHCEGELFLRTEFHRQLALNFGHKQGRKMIMQNSRNRS